MSISYSSPKHVCLSTSYDIIFDIAALSEINLYSLSFQFPKEVEIEAVITPLTVTQYPAVQRQDSSMSIASFNGTGDPQSQCNSHNFYLY